MFLHLFQYSGPLLRFQRDVEVDVANLLEALLLCLDATQVLQVLAHLASLLHVTLLHLKTMPSYPA